MNKEGSPGAIEGFDPEKVKAFEARAAFKAYVDEFGLDEVEGWFKTAEKNRERGLKGFTIPVDDNSSYMTIDEQVSFQRETIHPYVIDMDTALACFYELHQEAEEAAATPPQEM